VAIAGLKAPKLRQLSLDPSQISRRDAAIDREFDAEEVGRV
jgi:hypothetical protein